MIPTNLRPRFPVRGKVRAGLKVNGVPRSTDYFLSDVVGFNQLAGEKPHPLDIILPYAEIEECFSVALEYWAGPKFLGCYSKDGETAHRLVADDGWTLNSDAKGRTDVVCRNDNCPDTVEKRCKAAARLFFWLAKDTDRQTVWQFDTRGRESIQRMMAALSLYPGQLQYRPAKLWIEMRSGTGRRWPVYSITLQGEAPALAVRPVDSGGTANDSGTTANVTIELAMRQELDETLRRIGKDPNDGALAAWIGRVGVAAALDEARRREVAAGEGYG